MKLIIILGASKGIGLSVARKLVQQGHRLILGVQNVDEFMRSNRINNLLPNDNVEVIELELTDLDSIRAFASRIDSCQVLINNAGVMSPKLEYVNGIERTMHINHLGHFLLTDLLIPKLIDTSIQTKSECRILNLSSVQEQKAMAFPGSDFSDTSALRGELPDSALPGTKISTKNTFFGLMSSIDWMKAGPQPYFMHSSYANASLCILLSSFDLARRLQQRAVLGGEGNVTVNAVCPGYVNTSLWEGSMVWSLVGKFLFKNPDKAAETISELATSNKFAGVSGKFITSLAQHQPSPASLSEVLAERVRVESRRLVSLPDEDTVLPPASNYCQPSSPFPDRRYNVEPSKLISSNN
jgi:NAD(P)-dependent dehydrogenase (short-subunit alcohol dehydrogenase family)